MEQTCSTHSHNSVEKTDHSAEPADPPRSESTHRDRRQTRLAPQESVEKIPDPFVECGCGGCSDSVDPLADDESNRSAAEVCPSPQPVTVERAREIYIRYDVSKDTDGSKTSKLEYHQNELYPRILAADRDFQRLSNLTTVMVTRRLSPLDDNGDWLTPFEINEMLNGSKVRRSVRASINNQLEGYLNMWVGVTAVTDIAATPHEHLYYWIHDPNDEITVDHFAPGLEKHLKYCENAYWKDHGYAEDGTEGAITVRHDPPAVDQPTENLENAVKLMPESDSPADYRQPTCGAQYLASQLAYLPLKDQLDADTQNPDDTKLEGSAIAWACQKSRQWFRESGIPKLGVYTNSS